MILWGIGLKQSTLLRSAIYRNLDVYNGLSIYQNCLICMCFALGVIQFCRHLFGVAFRQYLPQASAISIQVVLPEGFTSMTF